MHLRQERKEEEEAFYVAWRELVYAEGWKLTLLNDHFRERIFQTWPTTEWVE